MLRSSALCVLARVHAGDAQMIIWHFIAWNDWTFCVVPRKLSGVSVVDSGLGRAHWRIGFWFIHRPDTGPGDWRISITPDDEKDADQAEVLEGLANHLAAGDSNHV